MIPKKFYPLLIGIGILALCGLLAVVAHAQAMANNNAQDILSAQNKMNSDLQLANNELTEAQTLNAYIQGLQNDPEYSAVQAEAADTTPAGSVATGGQCEQNQDCASGNCLVPGCQKPPCAAGTCQ